MLAVVLGGLPWPPVVCEAATCACMRRYYELVVLTHNIMGNKFLVDYGFLTRQPVIVLHNIFFDKNCYLLFLDSRICALV